MLQVIPRKNKSGSEEQACAVPKKTQHALIILIDNISLPLVNKFDLLTRNDVTGKP